MKKQTLLKALLLPSTLSISVTPFCACGTKPEKPVCPGHEKGDLIYISPNKVEGLTLPGIYKCKHCGEQMYDEITLDQIGVPTLFLNGDLSGISKETKVKIECSYRTLDALGDFDYDCTLKIQGASSSRYPKKNYNMVLYDKDSTYEHKHKIKMKENWPECDKFTLKANYIDSLGARNIICANLWGNIVHQRSTADDLGKSFNGGGIDGYPICLYINGEFNGYYTLNVPKGNEQFGMSKSDSRPQAIIFNNFADDSARFLKPIDLEHNNWEIEYCNKEDQSWIIPSFNNLINFVNNSTDEEFKNNIGNYLDVDRTIDYLILLQSSCLIDNYHKNILWVTYDGTHWIPSAYDLDASFGMYWDGNLIIPSNFWADYSENYLFERIYKIFSDLLINQYCSYRQTVLSNYSLNNLINSYINSVPKLLFDSNLLKWPFTPSWFINTQSNFNTFIQSRMYWLDKVWK